MSTMTTSENTFQEAATYGALVDAIGGVATIVLAIIALSSIDQPVLAAIATIVFGAALLIQGGTMLTEYTKLVFPSGTVEPVEEGIGGGGLSALLLVGSAGIVLGVLSLIGIAAETLISVAVIAFGGALLLSSNSVWHLYRAKQTWHRVGAARTHSAARFSPAKWRLDPRRYSACRASPRSFSASWRSPELGRRCSRWSGFSCSELPCC